MRLTNKHQNIDIQALIYAATNRGTNRRFLNRIPTLSSHSNMEDWGRFKVAGVADQ